MRPEQARSGIKPDPTTSQRGANRPRNRARIAPEGTYKHFRLVDHQKNQSFLRCVSRDPSQGATPGPEPHWRSSKLLPDILRKALSGNSDYSVYSEFPTHIAGSGPRGSE